MIYIMRHGKTELNRVKALQGRSDGPLNDEGIRQADQLAAFHRVLGSMNERIVECGERKTRARCAHEHATQTELALHHSVQISLSLNLPFGV